MLAAPAAWAADLPPLPADADEALKAAHADVQRFPQDYGAWVALARAAGDAHPDLAIAAWTEAEALSGGNIETTANQVMPRLSVGDVAGAQDAAARAAALDPTRADLKLLRAEALRHAEGKGSLYRAAIRAHGPTQEAYALDPASPEVWCGLGWSRLRLGNTVGARKAFDEAAALGGDCGGSATEAAGLVHRLYASTWASGLRYPTLTGLGVGVSGGVHAGATLADLASLGATVRGTRIATPPGAGPVRQKELWASASVHHAGAGAQAMVGRLSLSSSAFSGPPGAFGPGAQISSEVIEETATVVGGRLWGSWWASVGLEGARSVYDDGAGWQAALSASLPVLEPLTLGARAQLTAFTDAEDITEGLVATGESGQPLLSGAVSGAWHQARWGVSAEARFGPEIRPVRFDDAYVWNLSQRLVGGGGVTLSLRPKDALSLSAGYQLNLIRTPLDAPTVDIESQHTLTLGIAGQWEIRR
ncbi:MAG: hypothetical protein H6739_25575 [Alphaproteobacteria bacterium]|nr:hypothetical protein [Alphaproteobacteria bacterium]